MSEEVVYKSQEKALMTGGRGRTALVLIGGGLGLLALTLSGVSLMEFLAPLIFIGGFGALLMMPAYQATADQPRRGMGAAAPGAMFLTLGALISVLGFIGHEEAMAYSWALLPLSFVAGLMYARRFEADHPIHEKGPRLIRLFSWLFVGFGLFFELLVFENLGPWWPLALIGYGLYLLVRRGK